MRERHDDGKVTRAIVAVPLDGSAASDARRDPRAGHRRRLLRVPHARRRTAAGWPGSAGTTRTCRGTAPSCGSPPLENGVPGQSRLLKGSLRESVLAPLWRDNAQPVRGHRLDRLVEHLPARPDAASRRRRCTRPTRSSPGRCGSSAARPFALLGDGRLAVTHGRGGARLGILDPETSELTDLDLPFDRLRVRRRRPTAPSIVGHRRRPAGRPASVVRVDAATGAGRGPARASSTTLPDEAVPAGAARRSSWRARTAGWCTRWSTRRPTRTRPARRASCRRTWSGCTAARPATSPRVLDLEKAYFTSRGIGDHRRELRRLDRLRPLVPGAAAPPVGRRRRRGRHGRGAVAGRRRARPTRPGWPSAAARRAAGPRWPRSPPAHRPRPGVQRGDVLLRRLRPARLRRAHARLRVALPGRADRPAARLRGRLRRARPGRARDRRHLPGAAAAGPGRPGRAARAVREHRRRPGRARHPARVPRLRGRVARLPQGRDRDRRRWRPSCRSTARSSASRRPASP